jgi:photosystem II stability/assembly factor-like uncharacterized protein
MISNAGLKPASRVLSVRKPSWSINAAALIGFAILTSGAHPAPSQHPVVALDAWTLILERRGTGAGRYEDLAFPDEKTGWVVTAQGDILHTSDAGKTWLSQATDFRGLRSIDFLDTKRGFAGTLTGKLYGTTDGGATWNDITADLPATAKGFCGITHVGNEVHVVGRYIGAATDYFYSPDAGKTWRHADLGHLAQGLVDVAFVSNDVGFIGGMARSGAAGQGPAAIFKTTDGGKHWHTVYQHDGGRGFAWKLFPVSRELIFASLQSEDGIYRIAKSTNGGDTWTTITVTSGRTEHLWVQGIGFVDEKVGFIGGFFQGMWATTDGGASWTRIAVPHGTINRFERMGKTLVTAGSGGVLRFDGAASATSKGWDGGREPLRDPLVK